MESMPPDNPSHQTGASLQGSNCLSSSCALNIYFRPKAIRRS